MIIAGTDEEPHPFAVARLFVGDFNFDVIAPLVFAHSNAHNVSYSHNREQLKCQSSRSAPRQIPSPSRSLGAPRRSGRGKRLRICRAFYGRIDYSRGGREGRGEREERAVGDVRKRRLERAQQCCAPTNAKRPARCRRYDITEQMPGFPTRAVGPPQTGGKPGATKAGKKADPCLRQASLAAVPATVFSRPLTAGNAGPGSG